MEKDNHKKRSAQGDAFHKKNYKEYTATVDDIERFLSDNIVLRHNVLTGRTEYRVPERDAFAEWEAEGLTADDDGQVWQTISDRVVNTLWRILSREKKVKVDDIWRVIGSDFVPTFNPFTFYLEHLPPWDGQDYILGMSVSVTVKGDTAMQMRFYEYLKKWLVGMVAGWVDAQVVNNVILVLIGEQGAYKTTWFQYLLPPDLRRYFRIKTNSSHTTKDDLLALTQYGLVCYEELDAMTPRDLNQLKSAVTMTSVDERVPYDRYPDHRPHVASFCGTGNNVQFLSDETGNRRWLPFEIDSICSPRDEPFNYDGIYAQAYALYRQGFQFWFSQAEIQRLARHNEAFEAPHPEQELILEYLRKPGEGEQGVFLSVSNILQLVGSNPVLRLTANKIGRTMTALGFERQRFGQERGYVVVLYSPEEIKARQRTKAYEARPECGVGHDADDTNVTIF